MARRPASDFTGRQREQQVKDAAEAQSARANEITMASASAAAKLETEVVDVTGFAPLAIEEVEVSLSEQEVIIRVNEDLNPTIGAKAYTFKVGQKYKVPKYVADHLEEKGVLWH